MIQLLTDHVQNAYHSLKSNRGRTLLTVLGIAIGIASVTCTLAISDGVRNMVDTQVSAFQGRLAVVRPGFKSHDPNQLVNPVTQQSFSTSTLTDADTSALAKLPNVEAAVPLMTIEGTIHAQHATGPNSVVLATTPDFAKVSNITMLSGKFLDDTADNNTAVIGVQLAISLFETDHPIGEAFTLRGQQFTVVGVLRQDSAPINFNNVDLNNAVVVSFEQGKNFNQGRSQIQQIDLLTKKASDLESVTKQAKTKLLAKHLGEEDFSITSGKAITQPTSQLFQAMTGVMTAIATISLVVGGIGIMNIMLVGVAERTREIGIRKAVGASQRAIVAQFLIEALIMSGFGGLIGYGFGYLSAFIVSVFLYFTPAFSWSTAGIALIMMVAVGLFFGLYPALKAARKDTIESLRQYH
jgi:ABC-type antimicrobial peptide transport system permease subunit